MYQIKTFDKKKVINKIDCVVANANTGIRVNKS